MKTDFTIYNSLILDKWYVRNSDRYFLDIHGNIHSGPIIFEDLRDAAYALNKWKMKSGLIVVESNEFINEDEMNIQ